MNSELMKELKEVVDIPEGINLESLTGVMAFAKLFFPDLIYAQNGNILELRWSKADPPFQIPATGAFSRVARKILDTPGVWQRAKTIKPGKKQVLQETGTPPAESAPVDVGKPTPVEPPAQAEPSKEADEQPPQ